MANYWEESPKIIIKIVFIYEIVMIFSLNYRKFLHFDIKVKSNTFIYSNSSEFKAKVEFGEPNQMISD